MTDRQVGHRPLPALAYLDGVACAAPVVAMDAALNGPLLAEQLERNAHGCIG